MPHTYLSRSQEERLDQLPEHWKVIHWDAYGRGSQASGPVIERYLPTELLKLSRAGKLINQVTAPALAEIHRRRTGRQSAL